MIYDTIKFRKVGSERGVMSNGESDRLTKALKASWAMLYKAYQSQVFYAICTLKSSPIGLCRATSDLG
jgi:hypothetical protein